MGLRGRSSLVGAQQGHGALEGLRAVVLEPTGSLSVVPAGAPISEEFLTEVAGGQLLEAD